MGMASGRKADRPIWKIPYRSIAQARIGPMTALLINLFQIWKAVSWFQQPVQDQAGDDACGYLNEEVAKETPHVSKRGADDCVGFACRRIQRCRAGSPYRAQEFPWS